MIQRNFPVVTLCKSARSEIAYARAHKKRIRYLEEGVGNDGNEL